METFQLPLREIQEKFTRSELVLMAWRSQEQHFHFKEKFPSDKSKQKSGKKRKQYMDGIGPDVMPDYFFAQSDIRDERGRLIANEGDFNLGQVKGEEARQYFERVLRIPMPPNVVTKIRAEDSTSQEIRNAYGIRR